MMRSRTFTTAVLGAALLLAGCASDDGGDGDAAAAAPESSGSAIAVVGQDDLSWDQDSLAADAGEIEVELTCEDGVNHNIEIDGQEVAACDPGETATGTIDLDAGEYEYVCTVPGHESSMVGTLTVS